MTASELPIDEVPDGVVVVDRDLRIVATNEAARRLIGCGPADLVGLPVATLDPRDPDGKRLCEQGWPAWARLRTVGRLTEQTVLLRRPGGGDVPVAVTGRVDRDAHGRVTQLVLGLRSGTRRSRVVSGIEIVSTVSHELRSPLTSVKGYTSLLLNRWDRLRDDQKQMMLEQVNHDADRVTRLITELLDISRLETGRLILRRQLVDLPRLVATVIDKVRLEYQDLDVKASFPEGFPKVYADPDKLEQVLTNLLENACKYASPLGLTITGAVDDDRVSVAVQDQGEGIPAEDLPKVFSKFFRRAVGRPTGSGLGLWISRGLVESHGGELVAESILGSGSTFRFTLPLLDLDRLQES